jgi:hypothetical protein
MGALGNAGSPIPSEYPFSCGYVVFFLEFYELTRSVSITDLCNHCRGSQWHHPTPTGCNWSHALRYASFGRAASSRWLLRGMCSHVRFGHY